MNKHEAKAKVQQLEHSLKFLRIDSEDEIKKLKEDLGMYKDWFKTSQKDVKDLRNENSKLLKKLDTNVKRV